MAFKDLDVILYDGTIKIEYKDKAHRYYRRDRLSPDLPADDPKSWGKAVSVRGVTTMMDNVLEKKGLMTWPMGMALGELFGFYNFKNERGEQMLGFSKGKGTLWADGHLLNVDQETALPIVKSASESYLRKKKKGADIGSIVHDAIEQFVIGTPFEITLERYKEGQEFDTPEAEHEWLKQAAADVVSANLAFGKFVEWWNEHKPKLIGSEELLFSKLMDYCGTYDGLLGMGKNKHPVFMKLADKPDFLRIRCDWKTSNASTSRDAAAPQGVYYSYFIQLGFYEAAAQEMGQVPSDDLLCVSCRKDGGFDLVYASELGLSVQDCIDWAKAVHVAYKFMTKSKYALLEGGK